MVSYVLPSVGSSLELERTCPHCHYPHGSIHSGLRHRAVCDLRVRSIPQRRMRCPRCGNTWTIRATGVQEGCQRSRRLVGLGVVLYMLGLSYRGVEQFLPLLDCRGSKSAVERDVAAAGQQARSLHEGCPGSLRVRVLGVDGTGGPMAGASIGVLFFVDVDRRKLLCVEAADEKDAHAVRRHVRRVLQEVGAEELRTDEHSSYEDIVPEGRHRLCLTHWRKSKGKRAHDLLEEAGKQGAYLEEWSMQQLLDLLRAQPRPSQCPPELEILLRRHLHARWGLPWKVKQLLLHVERTWPLVSDDPHDATNNATEGIIGLSLKIRSKTMRGFKSLAKLLAQPLLASYLRGQEGVCDLRRVV